MNDTVFRKKLIDALERIAGAVERANELEDRPVLTDAERAALNDWDLTRTDTPVLGFDHYPSTPVRYVSQRYRVTAHTTKRFIGLEGVVVPSPDEAVYPWSAAHDGECVVLLEGDHYPDTVTTLADGTEVHWTCVAYDSNLAPVSPEVPQC